MLKKRQRNRNACSILGTHHLETIEYLPLRTDLGWQSILVLDVRGQPTPKANSDLWEQLQIFSEPRLAVVFIQVQFPST